MNLTTDTHGPVHLLLALAATGLLAAGLAACGDGEDSSGAAAEVAATTTQVADIAANVAGERAQVAGILTPSSDPHDYEPAPSDAEAVGDADLILRSGGDLDVWLDDLTQAAGTDAPVVELMDAVETIDSEGETDPHWWHDPANVALAAEEIRDQLAAADPDGAAEYERNAERYVREVEELDAAIGACMAAIPAEGRKLVTSHDALGYFAERYDIDVVGATIPALTTQAQPSAGETSELVELIRAEDVSAVFSEAGLSDDLAQAIAAETGATVGDDLYADTLAPDGAQATWLGATAANAEAIANALSGAGDGCELGL